MYLCMNRYFFYKIIIVINPDGQRDIRGLYKMRKFLSICVIFISLFEGFSFRANAQERTKIVDGYYVVNYGNVSVIEDDNRQMSIEIKVEKAGKTDYGEQLYNVLCKNEIVKTVAKEGLSLAISAALSAAGVPIPSWVLGPLVGYVYESVCSYYKEDKLCTDD